MGEIASVLKSGGTLHVVVSKSGMRSHSEYHTISQSNGTHCGTCCCPLFCSIFLYCLYLADAHLSISHAQKLILMPLVTDWQSVHLNSLIYHAKNFILSLFVTTLGQTSFTAVQNMLRVMTHA